jgi:predicted nucleic acid-binding protein
MFSLDTNVLVYVADPSDAKKHQLALKLMARACAESWPLCLQVYGEFFSAAVRRGHATRDNASDVILEWQALMPPIASSLAAHRDAMLLATKHQLQFWDALIIATCAEHGVTTLYTEDVPGKAKPLGVRCVNPFK